MKSVSLTLVSLFLAMAPLPLHGQTKAKDKKDPAKPAVTETAPKMESAPATEPISNSEMPPAPTEAPPAPPVAQETPPPTPVPSARHYFGLHGALGLPHPLTYGLNYVHPSQIFSAELSMGAYSMTVDGVAVKMDNTEVGLRWHPFTGSFYVGALLGQRKIVGEKTEVISGQSITATIDVKSSYAAPHVGWMWGMDDGGFFVSMDLGVVSPSGATSTVASNADAIIQATQEYQDLKKDVEDQGKKIGETTLPLWTLLKIGYLF